MTCSLEASPPALHHSDILLRHVARIEFAPQKHGRNLYARLFCDLGPISLSAVFGCLQGLHMAPRAGIFASRPLPASAAPTAAPDKPVGTALAISTVVSARDTLGSIIADHLTTPHSPWPWQAPKEIQERTRQGTHCRKDRRCDSPLENGGRYSP
jgi:hypothetical protein